MDALPPNANLYFPILVEEVRSIWPEFKNAEYFGAQVEQETCISLKHKKCWNPKTENINPKNNNEYGFGLGQITKTNKFNVFEESKAKYSNLKSWKWEDRFDPKMQLRALVNINRTNFEYFKGAEPENALAFALSAYNGGLGSVIKDRKYCAQFDECDPDIWFGHVEKYSLKPRTSLSGYNSSAYKINREYVDNIMNLRYRKYADHIKQYYPEINGSDKIVEGVRIGE